MFSEINPITFREVEKSLPCVKGGGTACRDGGIVKVSFKSKTIPQPPSASAPFTQGSLFMFIYDLSIFLTSTAFVSANAKIRHASFEIYRISENSPLENRSKRSFFLVLPVKRFGERGGIEGERVL